MVEKIEVIENEVKEIEIKGKIYSINLMDIKEFIKYKKALDKVVECKNKLSDLDNKNDDEIEKIIIESIESIHNFINVALNDENAVEDILGNNKNNLHIIFDFINKLQKTLSPYAESFIKERIKAEYGEE